MRNKSNFFEKNAIITIFSVNLRKNWQNNGMIAM